MPTFTAGDPINAFTTRRALPKIAVTVSDVSVVSLDVVVDAPGLFVQLDEFGQYAVDGFIAYSSLSTASDLRLAFAAPFGATGSWSGGAPIDTATSATASASFFRGDLDNEAGYVGGTSPVAGIGLHGYVTTTTFGGSLQIRFAQVTASASALTLRAGSWLRATLID